MKIDITIARDLAFVEKHGYQTPDVLEFLESSVLTKRSIKKANVILTTAHKSKGLEWSQVYLYDDFRFKLPENREYMPRSEREELNLLYVAITRAVNTLYTCDSYNRFLNELENPTQKREVL